MHKAGLTIGLGIVAIALTAGSANAQFQFPKKANKFQATLVTAYTACVAPNDTASGALPLPACHPAAPIDTVCGWDNSNPAKPLGQGQIQAVVAGKGATADIKLQAKLQGLSSGCIGETLCIWPSLRSSSLGCLSGDPGGCTVLEGLTNPFNLGAGGCGVVDDKGKLQIKTTVDTIIPGLVAGGTHLTVDLARTGIRRTTGASLPSLTFAAGLDAN